MLQALASLAGLPSRQSDDVVLEQRMYFVALEGVTRYGLSEAVKAVMRGKLGHTFFPSPVELRLLCDQAMRPHREYARRIRLTEHQMAERRRERAFQERKTPEARARVATAYEKFCEGYRQERPDAAPLLDPELVAKVPDAPTTWKRSA